MDINCPKCGEPWDVDELHGVIEERYSRKDWLTDSKYDQSKYDVFYRQVRAEFRKDGCAVFGTKCNGNVADPIIGEILDLAGDDLDGAASDLDDARRFFGDHFKVIPVRVPFRDSGAARREPGEDFEYAVEDEGEWI